MPAHYNIGLLFVNHYRFDFYLARGYNMKA